jgi:hypothetical protein
MLFSKSVIEGQGKLSKIFPGQQFHTQQASVSLISKSGQLGHLDKEIDAKAERNVR